MTLRKIPALLLAGAVLAGCASADTNSDEAAVVYDAGGFGEDTTFSQCQGPNLNDYYEPGTLAYIYPMGQRTYEFRSGAENREQDDVTVVSKDGVRMTVAGFLNFRLNGDCDTLRKFHEQIGLKYGAGAGENGSVSEWTALLNKYLGTPLTSVMISTATQYTWRELYSEEAKRSEWLGKVSEELGPRIEALAEGPYFEGFTLEVPAVLPPAELLAQITEQQVQNERINTINAQAAAQAAEAEQMRQLVDLLGKDGYILYRQQIACENGGHCPNFVPIPQGSDIVVNGG